MSDSDAVFRQAALKSQLLTEKDLEEAVRTFRTEDPDQANTAVEISDEKMADQLVEMGLVNRWQAEQLKLGRTRFHLKDYQIIDSIGKGGMGEVYKAEHSLMGRVVAIKVLSKIRSTDDAVANFQREIRTLANLDHPNLVRAYDAGHDGNVHFLVTEFVPGTTLRHLVRHGSDMHEQDAATLVRGVARGLEHAHQRGLVHRDVKPGNIMVTPEGMVKVLDLGLAGFLREELELHSSKERNPKKGRIVGTADYIAPEVIEGHPATAASDIYGLGCTLYYAVTRKVPFPGGSSVQKCHRHLSEQPMDPRRFRQDMSDDFLSILNDMLAKDPQKRLQTATEVIERLAPWGGSNLSGAMQKMETPLSASGLRLDTDQSLQDTDQPSGGSQMTTPLPPPRKGRRPQKTGRLFKAITEGIGGMSEIQFYALVGGLSLLIVVLLILLFSF